MFTINSYYSCIISKQRIKYVKVCYDLRISSCESRLPEMKITILRIRKLLVDRPTLVTFGLALAIVVFIGTTIGMLSDQQQIQQQSHEAFAVANKHAVCHTCGASAAEWAAVRYSDVIN